MSAKLARRQLSLTLGEAGAGAGAEGGVRGGRAGKRGRGRGRGSGRAGGGRAGGAAAGSGSGSRRAPGWPRGGRAGDAASALSGVAAAIAAADEEATQRAAAPGEAAAARARNLRYLAADEGKGATFHRKRAEGFMKKAVKAGALGKPKTKATKPTRGSRGAAAQGMGLAREDDHSDDEEGGFGDMDLFGGGAGSGSEGEEDGGQGVPGGALSLFDTFRPPR